jgi:hypothetical protein
MLRKGETLRVLPEAVDGGVKLLDGDRDLFDLLTTNEEDQ